MKKTLKHLLALSVLLGISATQANAEAQALTNLQTYSGVNPIQTSCATCHSTIPSLNTFGTAFRNAGGTKGAGYVLTGAASTTLLNSDADGDGISNLAELQAGTNPAGDGITTTNTQTATTTGCITSDLTMQALMFLGLFTATFLVTRKKAKNTNSKKG